MPTRNMTAELPVVLDVLSDDLENCFLFVEEGENFFYWLLQHPHFVGETSNQHPHFFPRCRSGGSTLESRITEAKENTSTDNKN